MLSAPALSTVDRVSYGSHRRCACAPSTSRCWASAASFVGEYDRSDEQGGQQAQRRTRSSQAETSLKQRVSKPLQAARHSPEGESDDSVSISLFAPFQDLPPEGKTRTAAEEACNPYERNCQVPMHVWETKCVKCYATGTICSFGRRGSTRMCYTCPSCHGLGFVRRTSSRITPDLNNGSGHYTLGRSQPEQKPDKDAPKKPKSGWLQKR